MFGGDPRGLLVGFSTGFSLRVQNRARRCRSQMSEGAPRLEHTFDLVGVGSLVAQGAPQFMSSSDIYGGGDVKRRQRERLDQARSVLAAVEARQSMHSVSGFNLSGESESSRSYGVYHVRPSTEAMVEALANTVGPQDWVAVVAVTDIGWEAAQNLGIDTRRVVVVSHPKDEAGRVIASIIEGFDVVALGDVAVRPSEQRALAGRARKLNTTVLTMSPWQTVSKPFVGEGSARKRDREQMGTFEVLRQVVSG